MRVDEKDYLPSLIPYRAEASLTLQVIEGNNPFYQVETVRQMAFAALNTVLSPVLRSSMNSSSEPPIG